MYYPKPGSRSCRRSDVAVALVLTDPKAASIPLLDTTDIHEKAAVKLAWAQPVCDAAVPVHLLELLLLVLQLHRQAVQWQPCPAKVGDNRE
jgi:hypothetical protein